MDVNELFVGEAETDTQDEPEMDARTRRRLAHSRMRRARRALMLARSGLIVAFPSNDGWGPRWAA